MAVSKEQAAKFYETMCTIRCFEESVKKDFLNGEIPGFVHMLHTSEIYEEATHSADIGIVGEKVSVDWPKVQAFRASVVEKLTSGVKALVKLNKIALVEGEAKFTGPKTVKVGEKELAADKIILAAGSYPIIPGIPGLADSKAVIDSTACLSLDHIPESLLVIGGGVIGLELGSVYLRYGAKVTVVEMLPKLLPLMDGELTGMLQSKLAGQGMEILTGSQVLSVEDTAKGAKIRVKCPDGEKTVEAEKVLVSVGRGPLTQGLDLAKAGIQEEKGFIRTNAKMETNVPGVYAVGDCTGKLMLAHAAMVLTARMIKSDHPGCKVVFVGPCDAKKLEARRKSVRSEVDYVLTFEEVLGMFAARGVDREIIPEEETEPLNQASESGRNFAFSGGVAAAVVNAIQEKEPGREIKVAHAAVEKGPAGEFAGARLPRAQREQRVQRGAQHGGGTVTLEFGGILAGIAVGRAAEGAKAHVQYLPVRIHKVAVDQRAVGIDGQGPARAGPEQGLRQRHGPAAGQTHDADGGHGPAGGHGGDGI